MKIKNKILVTFILFIFLIIVSSVSISLFLRCYYMDIKYQVARNYYINNEVTLDEYADYLLNKGFVVTSSKLETYKDYGNQVCPYQENPIIVYENDEPVLYAVINDNIVNDNLIFMNYILAFITFLILILLIIVYFLINKVIIKRIEYVEKTVKEYKSNSLQEISNKLSDDKYNDEISSLKREFKILLDNINENEKNKQMLVMALSHELKSPLTKIEAILDMYSENLEGYDSKEKVIELLEVETKYIDKNISRLLDFYKNYNNQYDKENIDFNSFIKKIFNDDFLIKQKLDLKIIENNQFEICTSVDKLEIVINNIKENLIKHACKDEAITIQINENEIEFKNKISPNAMKSTKVGNIINDFLVSDMNLEIIREVKNDSYSVKIKKFSKTSSKKNYKI